MKIYNSYNDMVEDIGNQDGQFVWEYFEQINGRSFTSRNTLELTELVEKLKNCNNCHNSLKYIDRHKKFCPRNYTLCKCEKWEEE